VCGDFYTAARQGFVSLANRVTSLNQKPPGRIWNLSYTYRVQCPSKTPSHWWDLPGQLDWSVWERVASSPASLKLTELRAVAEHLDTAVSSSSAVYRAGS
jgi:hypothetical protein